MGRHRIKDPRDVEAVKRFGMRLKARLDASGCTQRAFAGQMGASQTTVTSWVKGNTDPTLLDIYEMSRLLRVTPAQLIDDDDAVDPLIEKLADPDVGKTIEDLDHLSREARRRAGNDLSRALS